MMVLLASNARRTNMKILQPTLVKLAPITPILPLQAMPSPTASVMRGIRDPTETPVWPVTVELTRHLQGQMLAPLVTITQYPQPAVLLQMIVCVTRVFSKPSLSVRHVPSESSKMKFPMLFVLPAPVSVRPRARSQQISTRAFATLDILVKMEIVLFVLPIHTKTLYQIHVLTVLTIRFRTPVVLLWRIVFAHMITQSQMRGLV